MPDLADCTCIKTVGFSKRAFPCPVHGMTFATKTERIELLEERVSRLETCGEERSVQGHVCPDCGQHLLYGTGHLNCPGRAKEGSE